MKRNRIPTLLIMIAMLVACGQTGPLFMPEKQPAEQASEPGPAKETDKQSGAAKAGKEERTDIEEVDVELKEKTP